MLKVSFISLGCDKNLVDSEVMLGLLKKAGYEIISDETQADIIVVNSCCFIQSAIEESIENILEVSKYKIEGNCKILVVAGCMAERYKQEIFDEIPEVDIVLGTTAYEKIAEAIQNYVKENKLAQFNDLNARSNEENYKDRILTTAGYFAYLKIAEGCNNFCTYCVIPKVRGKYRSRSMESLLEEAQSLVNQGVKELIIVAQDTTRYGVDLYGEKKLPELLRKLAQIEDLEWIRLLYCYPEQVTDELIDTIAAEPKICKYVDMPIQHANDNILKRMARRSTQAQLREVIGKFRKKVPDIAIRTTLITGFPGETEEEFEDMLKFVEEMEFDRLGVFTYSQEDGTAAAKFENQIDESIKEERKERILELQKAISAKKCENSIGKIYRVLVEGKLPEDDIYCGRTYKDTPDIDGLVFIKSEKELLSGDFADVLINGALDYDLEGEVIYEDEFGK